MDALFEFLFKYRLLLFQEGDLSLSGRWPTLVTLAMLALVVIPTVFSYSIARGASQRSDRAVMLTLRLTALGILTLMLLRPTLILTSVVPQQNFVGILIDDSESMTVRDASGVSRADYIQQTFGPEGSALLDQLSDRFALRFFRFSSSTQRLTDVSELTYTGNETNLGSALQRAHEELSGVPLSGLVVFSDGADNSSDQLAESLRPLQAASVPVYSVGLGEEALDPDIQVSRIEMPRTVLEGTSLVVDVVVGQRGFGGKTVSLVVEDAGRIIATEEIAFESDGEPVVARVRFEAAEAGPRLLEFRVPVQDGERIIENNAREVLLEVRDRNEKVLYFEGEPRWEVKFLRRAVADDDNLQVVVLQRTAANKFLRLDVDDPEELSAGFPRTREELFQYRAIILGSVEASFFTNDQLNMIADFVSERGGGLIVLGGRNAYAQGGYIGTPLEDVLPVIMSEDVAPGQPFFSQFTVAPTRSGLTHPITQLGSDPEASAERWRTLPSVSTLNPITRLKPGATALLMAEGGRGEDEQVVLAFHRYGRGRVLALPIQDTWTWQMHADVPLEDQTHETFWKQTVRWLVDGVPDVVAVQTEQDQVQPGSSVTVRAMVADSAYEEVNNGQVLAMVTSPTGDSSSVLLDWTVDVDGLYTGSFVAEEPGLYTVSVDAERTDQALGEGVTHVHSVESVEEFFDAGMHATTLARVADETGGRFYTPANVGELPEDLSVTGAGVTLTEERDLWDMPILLFLLVAAIGSEWLFRRARGLV